MRILLIAMPNVMAGFDRVGRIPNLGLTSMAGNLTGCQVRVVDLVLVRRSIQDFIRTLLGEFAPELVGLSCMTFQFRTAMEIARIVKSYDHRVSIAVGGYHPSLLYEEIADSAEARVIDFMVRGEGEGTFARLVEALKVGGDLAAVPGISYKEAGTFHHNPPADLLALEEVRLPDRSARHFSRGFHCFGLPADAVETSRGCTFGCYFCSVTEMYGRRVRLYSIPRVLADLRAARAGGARAIFFVDDNITLDVSRFEEICEAIVAERLNDLQFVVQASVAGIGSSHRLVQKMARANFRLVFLGIENASRESLDFLGKDPRARDLAAQAVGWLREQSILVAGGLIMGLPEDREEDLWANFHLARELKLDCPLFFVATPYPRTRLRQELLDRGLVTNPRDYTWYNGGKANIRTRHLSTDAIDRILVEMYRRYFDWAYLRSTNVWRNYPAYFLKMVASSLARTMEPKQHHPEMGRGWRALATARARDRKRRQHWLLGD
jgi:radical SAM superfamily enzyme YgiQ (UPF0313 family)